METGAILLLAAVLLIVSAVVIRPWMPSIKNTGRTRQTRPSTNQQFSVWLAEKERLLNMIQELDFDHETGKIPDELFNEQRSELVQSAAQILKQLADNGYTEPTSSKPINDTTSRPANVREYDDLDELIAKRRLEKNGKATGFCPKCGNPLQTSDRFCPKCGTTIQVAN